MLPTANFEKTKGGTSSAVHIYDNDVVYEIFTWLPARSLMRFKSLGKFWNTKIACDSYFIQIHRRRAAARRGGEKLLLHFDNNVFDRRGYKHTLISIDKYDSNHLRELYSHFCPYKPVIVVDGLVCFYNRGGSRVSASLHNLSTHESIALPEDSNFNDEFRKRTFLFIGFDSSHTLLKILCKINLIDYQTVFEICTVGIANNSWRIINAPPFECSYCHPWDSGVCINGVIYWISWCSAAENNESCRGLNIKAFDVNDEKFHLISFPHNCQVDRLRNVDGVLTLVDPHLRLSHSGYVIKMWRLEDYKNQVWVKESILVDFDRELLSSKVNPILVGTIGCGELLMTQRLEGGIEALTYYDRARRISRVEELDIYYDGKVLGTYVENIMPLTAFIN